MGLLAEEARRCPHRPQRDLEHILATTSSSRLIAKQLSFYCTGIRASGMTSRHSGLSIAAALTNGGEELSIHVGRRAVEDSRPRGAKRRAGRHEGGVSLRQLQLVVSGRQQLTALRAKQDLGT